MRMRFRFFVVAVIAAMVNSLVLAAAIGAGPAGAGPTSAAVVGASSVRTRDAYQAAGSQKRLISEKDLFDFVWIANPQLSPDGKRVAFTRVNVDEKRTGYETSIWIVASDGKESPVRMTNGKHDAQPRWSPDGSHIAFVRGGEKDDSGKPKPGQLALLSLAGGEAKTITDLPKGASDAVWSPDGRQIAFMSSTTQEDIDKAQHKKNAAKGGDGKEAESEHECDVHVISHAIYRSNDEGYLDPKRHEHIWILQLPASTDEIPKPVQLTSGKFDEDAAVWSRDGSRIYFLTRRGALLRTTEHRYLLRARGRGKRRKTGHGSHGDWRSGFESGWAEGCVSWLSHPADTILFGA
jgi:dipeptidyl aminopeptidase/acylaminoacyl peptidase